jgi:hypothetical protein
VEHSDADYLDNLVCDLLWLLAYQNQPTDKELLRVGLKEFDGAKLYQLCREVRLSIVEVGASASESDLRTHRDIILDALVRIDCGFEWTGQRAADCAFRWWRNIRSISPVGACTPV